MTPKEKALQIFMKYAPDLINELGMSDYVHAINIRFAIITVDEIINNLESICNKGYASIILENEHMNINEVLEYYDDVKKEIENL